MRPPPLAILVAFLTVSIARAESPPPAPLLTLRHEPIVTDVSVSPDGRTIATSGVDGTARLWDAATGKPGPVLKGHEGRVTAVAFARGGEVVVTAGGDGTVRLWETASGRPLQELRRHIAEVRALAVSADGRRIASGGVDKTICLWDAAAGTLLRQLRPYQYRAGDNPEEGVVFCLALSTDGALLAAGHRVFDFNVYVWDVASGERLARIGDEANHVAAVVFSPDGATLASVSNRGRNIQLWETATWRSRRRLKIGAQPWQFPGAFSPDGWRLAAAAAGGVNVWDLSTGEPVGMLSGSHGGRVTALAYLEGGRRIVSGGDDGAAFVWDAAPLLRPAPAGREKPLPQDRLDKLWADLAQEDSARAYEALWALAAAPAQAVPLIADEIKLDEPMDAEKARQWVRELDDDRFTVRERATRQLAHAGDAAEPFLREAMAKRPSVEVAQRVEALLQALASPRVDSDSLRALRAVEVLERAATPEAHALLRQLGNGATGSKVRRRARGAAERLDHLKPAHTSE